MEVYSTTSSYPLKRDYNVQSFSLLSSSPVLHRLKALLGGIPVRLYQRGWECAGLIEAENSITCGYSAVFHRDKDGPRAAAADTNLSCSHLQPSLRTGTPVDKLHANIATFASGVFRCDRNAVQNNRCSERLL